MGSIGFPFKSSTCILIFLVLEGICVTCKETWCYDKPSCGPSTWGSLGFCNGKRQSPINIDTKKAILKDLGPIKFTNYEDRKIAKELKNQGFQPEVTFHPRATISNPKFPATYTLMQMHAHWGTEDSNGSEHTIDGQSCSMEVHLVHTKNNMSLEEAVKDPEGVIVLAVFVQKSSEAAEITSWNIVANLLKEIPEKGNTRALDGEFSVGGLLSTVDVSHYYTYKGSTTTPDCPEVVTWIVFPELLYISEEVVKKFTNSLYFTTIEENRRMQNTFRPIQPLNERKVYYYKENALMENALKINCLRRCFAQ